MEDCWESDDLKVKETIDGRKGSTEESADGDEKASDTEDDNNTNSNTRGKEEENGKEIKTPCG